MKKNKKSKKVNYSLMQNVCYILKYMWRWDKKAIFWWVMSVPGTVFISLLETYMAKNVVQIVTEQGAPFEILLCVGIFTGGIFLMYFLNNLTNARVWGGLNAVSDQFVVLFEERYMQVDYELLENPEFQVIAERARQFVRYSWKINVIMEKTASLFAAIFGIITYGVILWPLSPGIILLMAVISTSGYFIYGYNHRWERKMREVWAPDARRMWYNVEKLRDSQSAKDIRVYKMEPWLKERFKLSADKVVKNVQHSHFRWKIIDSIFAVMTCVRDFIAYGILIYKVYTEGMSAAEFVLYFNALMMFIRWLLQFYDGVDMARFKSYEFCDFRDFMEYDASKTKDGENEVPRETCDIQFQNVEYTYPGSENAALSSMDFTIRKGEKIAIVGPNGAGKTTLVKLMCGLYHPTAGKILVNGIDIREYKKSEYFGMFSSVFQDIAFLPKSIAENIALCLQEEINQEKLHKVVVLSGMEEKIERLTEGLQTMLVKEVQDGAISLSGGETQKLALARALYKEGRILVLDEPTAALDPIAESEIYQKYNELSEGKTSIFISHRLASTRFCDRIFYIENGRISEMGTHKELMELGGKYAEMYRVQSQYYTEEGQAMGGAEHE